MFNNIVSQPLAIPTWQMEPVSKQDSSSLNIEIGMTGPMSANSASRSAISNQPKVPLDQGSCTPGIENFMVSNKQLMSNQKVGEMGPMWNNVGLQKPLLPTKRKAAMEPLSTTSLPQQLPVADKRVAQTEPHVNSPRSSQLSALNKRNTQLQSMPSKSGSQRVQTPKSRTAVQEGSLKVQNGSFDAVRSKMRETLAAALSVGSQNQEKAPNEDKKSPCEAGNAQAQAHVDSHSAGSIAPSAEADAPPGSSLDIGKETATVDRLEDCKSTVEKTTASENIQNSHRTDKNDGQEPQYNYVMPDADGSFGDTFFVKDELLQGNGLSWAWDMEVAELKEVQIDEKSNSAHMDVCKNGVEQGQSGDIPKLGRTDVYANGTQQIVESPQELASKIEAELFKLFGGVNKKYKEKGRSLMFNLKDRNNPELREKVLSGVISPERLCSMTPEELASKELSEWRMAKAEELDKMIVLPDSDVDIRRLVKKTHKGEYQVEVEQDDAVSVEVSVGSSSFTQFQPKKKKTGRPSSGAYEVKEKEIAEGDKSGSENRHPASSLTIPADGTDFMQELIVDEFKDEGFLPPIVSLDEFMESLNSEPPFENLPVDSKEDKPLADKGNTETGRKTGSDKVSSEPASSDPVGAEAGTSDHQKVKSKEAFLYVNSRETSLERKTLPAVMGVHVWEGELQLTISSSVSVIALFRSGEKTSTKEWPSSMEIKGRVRLDAFEKFLQELPMSRSRAVMVVHFVLKDSSPEIHRDILSEAVDSYVGDERLGFGEPIPGVELYFCPRHTRITEMLSRHLAKAQTDILKPTDNGLIGVVVWRRPHISLTNSPNSSSHHKHHRMHNFQTRRHETINANVNSNSTAKSTPSGNVNRRLPPQPDNDDDDIPPGFGPGAAAARDEDDLPEFSFSGTPHSSRQKTPARVGFGSRPMQATPSRPVDQIRQLIHRYGQTEGDADGTNWNGNRGAGVGTKPWTQEDDDDMPEWQPQLPQKHHQPEVAMHSIHQLSSVPHMVNKIRPPMGQVPRPPMAMQPTANVLQNGVRWAPQIPGPHGLPPNVAIPGQHYGGPWRHDAPRSRGL